MTTDYKIHFDDLEWIHGDKGIRYKEYLQGRNRIRLIEFSEEMNHENWCITGHIAYVVSGTLEIIFTGKAERYHPGDSVIIPNGEYHKHKPRAVTQNVTIFSVENT